MEPPFLGKVIVIALCIENTCAKYEQLKLKKKTKIYIVS